MGSLGLFLMMRTGATELLTMSRGATEFFLTMIRRALGLFLTPRRESAELFVRPRWGDAELCLMPRSGAAELLLQLTVEWKDVEERGRPVVVYCELPVVAMNLVCLCRHHGQQDNKNLRYHCFQAIFGSLECYQLH